jgi:ketosteroid isomerase-like protein
MTTRPADLARAYLDALESRAPQETFESLLHPEAIVEVLPNRLDPRGSRRTRDEAMNDVVRGRALLREERYEVTSAVEHGDRAVLEVTWSGLLAVPLGSLASGSTMRARCSMHFELRDGRIAEQRNYDCFDAF